MIVNYDYNCENYMQLPRFISYYHQIDAILKTKSKKILELGKGDGLISNYLKSCNVDITTYDNEESLNPDIIGDIRELPFEENSFDCVSASQILEHIPYEDYLKVLEKMSIISREYVLISLPVAGNYINFMTRFSGLKRFFSKEVLSFSINIPFFWKNKKFDGYHYWELGWKNYKLKKIRKDLERFFIIEKQYNNFLCPYHIFFVLKVKKNTQIMEKEVKNNEI